MSDLKINSSSSAPTDGPLSKSIDDQTWVEPVMTSTSSMKGDSKGKGKSAGKS